MRYFLWICFTPMLLFAERPFVSTQLMGQLGNQLFQISTAYALSRDNDADLVVPDLTDSPYWSIRENYERILFRVETKVGGRRVKSHYKEPRSSYKPIPYSPNMQLHGYFQSARYFDHYRDELWELFTPHPEFELELKERYRDLLDHPCTVAVHVRTYEGDDPTHRYFPFLGWDFFKKAMQIFPEGRFIVCSDRIKQCKVALQSDELDIHFIEGNSHFDDFFLMSYCHHQVISNSTFSWWAAYLNRHPEKRVIAPDHWFHCEGSAEEKDRIPPEWTILKTSKPKET